MISSLEQSGRGLASVRATKIPPTARPGCFVVAPRAIAPIGSRGDAEPLDGLRELGRLQAGLKQVMPNAVRTVQVMVAEQFQMSVAQMTVPSQTPGSRKYCHAFPRQVAMYLASVVLNVRREDVGAWFGGRDHTTVSKAIQVVRDCVDTEPATAAAVKLLSERIRQEMQGREKQVGGVEITG